MTKHYLALAMIYLSSTIPLCSMYTEDDWTADILTMSLEEIAQASEAQHEKDAQERAKWPEAFKEVEEYLTGRDIHEKALFTTVSSYELAEFFAPTNKGKTVVDLVAENPSDEKKIEAIFEHVVKRFTADTDLSPFFLAKNSLGNTPLHTAALLGNKAFMKRLLELEDLNLPKNLRNNRGETPLYIAAERGNKELVKLLVEHGEDVCAAALDGTTPLVASLTYRESRPTTLYLLEQDATKGCINYQDDQGDTVLHRVVRMGLTSEQEDEDFLMLLLKNGADESIENAEGLKPVELAQQIAEQTNDQEERTMRTRLVEKLLSIL